VSGVGRCLAALRPGDGFKPQGCGPRMDAGIGPREGPETGGEGDEAELVTVQTWGSLCRRSSGFRGSELSTRLVCMGNQLRGSELSTRLVCMGNQLKGFGLHGCSGGPRTQPLTLVTQGFSPMGGTFGGLGQVDD
jgi:hypothetical protein